MKRSKHTLSRYKLLTCNMGELIPAGWFSVLPGDTIQMASSVLLRCSPMVAPPMHPVHVRVHHFYVPYRLLWDNGKDDSWEAFITGGWDGMDASSWPNITFNNLAIGTLGDYLGVVPLVASNRVYSALPFRAYAKIWNEFYRDQDLQTELALSVVGGSDVTTSTALQNVNWEKDYFTTARPWTQKGPAVSLPLGTSAPITATGALQVDNAGGTQPRTLRFSNTVGYPIFDTAATVTEDARYKAGLSANLSGATAATINELRQAWAIQKYEEARARYGSRFVEYLRYLGIKSSDARLRRPEYLSGGKQTISFSEVLQTGVTTSGTPSTGVGSMLGHGIGAVRTNRFRRFFEEHGIVMSLLSVLPKTMYVNGMEREWFKSTKEDYFQKELQHIGQQPVYNKEVYAAHATPDGVFGYQDRYDEYRRGESSVAGDFRTTDNIWHFGRIFASDPALNSTFVGANPTTRVFQSTSTDTLKVMVSHSIQARRLVDKEGVSY